MQVGINKSHGHFKKNIGVLIPRWDLRRGIRNSMIYLPVMGVSNKTEGLSGDAESLDAPEASATSGAEKRGGVPTGKVAF